AGQPSWLTSDMRPLCWRFSAAWLAVLGRVLPARETGSVVVCRLLSWALVGFAAAGRAASSPASGYEQVRAVWDPLARGVPRPASGLAKDWPSPPRSRTRTGLAVRPSAGLADGTPRILRAWARVSANGDTAGQPSWLTLRHCGRFVGASLP